jgi:hypothetical protein
MDNNWLCYYLHNFILIKIYILFYFVNLNGSYKLILWR